MSVKIYYSGECGYPDCCYACVEKCYTCDDAYYDENENGLKLSRYICDVCGKLQCDNCRLDYEQYESEWEFNQCSTCNFEYEMKGFDCKKCKTNSLEGRTFYE